MTCSIVARDPDTGALGVAVLTGAPGVGAICPWTEAGVGAVCTQATPNAAFGPAGLELLRRGVPADRALAALVASDPMAPMRQVGLVDAAGRAAAHTGARCIPNAGHLTGDGFAVQANMMARPGVPDAMARAWAETGGPLSARLLAALTAADALGADLRGQRSAALVIAPGQRTPGAGLPQYDLRVDDDPRALDALSRMVTRRRAHLQIQAAWSRALAGEAAEALQACRQILADLPPEETQLRFWVAISFADRSGRVDLVADLIRDVFQRDRAYVEYVRRLDAAGRLGRAETAAAMLALANEEAP